jgi:hypothetical protein
MTTFKSDNQKMTELLERNDVKEIQGHLIRIYVKTAYKVYTHSGTLSDIVSLGDILLELVKRNSIDFTKDIAEKCLENEYNLSEKQAWCVAFQIKNNIEVYKIAMVEYDLECEKVCKKLDKELSHLVEGIN